MCLISIYSGWMRIDVVCEGTGVIPEAGAVHAKAALDNGKHVAMVNKETDSAVGPILKRLAAKKVSFTHRWTVTSTDC